MDGMKMDLLKLLKTVELEVPRDSGFGKSSETANRFDALFGQALNRTQEDSSRGMKFPEPQRPVNNERPAEPVRQQQTNRPAGEEQQGDTGRAAGQEKGKTEEAGKTEAKAEKKEDKKTAATSGRETENRTDTAANDAAALAQRIEQLVEKMMGALQKGKDLKPEQSKKIAEALEAKINQLLEGRLEIKIAIKADASISVDVKQAQKTDTQQTARNVQSDKPVQELLQKVETLAEQVVKQTRTEAGPERQSVVQATVTRLEVKEENTSGSGRKVDERHEDRKSGTRESVLEKGPRKQKDDNIIAAAVRRNVQQGPSDDAESRVLLASLARKRLSARPVTTQGLESTGRQVSGEDNLQISDVSGKSRTFAGVSLGKEGLMLRQNSNHASPLTRMAPVQQIAETIARSGKTTRLTMQLNPKDLGRVTLDLQVSGDKLVANFRAETSQARDSLQNNMHVLRDALAEKGFDTEKMEIRFAGTGADADGHFGHAGKERQEEEARREKQEQFVLETEADEQTPVNVIDAARRAAESSIRSELRLNLKA